MIPQGNGNESLDYVPGTSVLGFFARQLAGSEDFEELFFSGKVLFSPLYPVDANGVRCMPAPPFVVKAKGGMVDGSYFSNKAFAQLEDAQTQGVSAKPLKGGFVDGNWHPTEVHAEVVYHHSTGKTGVGDESTLYIQRCLSAGQELAGFIEVQTPELAKSIVAVLEASRPGGISFGRSKTAQYARCSLISLEASEPCAPILLKKGSAYAFLLDSDALLVDRTTGRVSTDYGTLCDEIRRTLGDKANTFEWSDVEDGTQNPGTSLAYRTITGYNAKWNQKRAHVRAIASGSAIVFEAASSTELPGEFVIGERRAEGFGRVLVVPVDSIASPITVVKVDKPASASVTHDALDELVSHQQQLEVLREAAIDYAESKRDEGLFGATRLNPAFVGRLTRMVEESVTGMTQLDARIASVSSDAKRCDSERLVNGLMKRLVEANGASVPSWQDERECLLVVLTLGKYYAKQQGIKDDASNMMGEDDE